MLQNKFILAMILEKSKSKMFESFSVFKANQIKIDESNFQSFTEIKIKRNLLNLMQKS